MSTRSYMTLLSVLSPLKSCWINLQKTLLVWWWTLWWLCWSLDFDLWSTGCIRSHLRAKFQFVQQIVFTKRNLKIFSVCHSKRSWALFSTCDNIYSTAQTDKSLNTYLSVIKCLLRFFFIFFYFHIVLMETELWNCHWRMVLECNIYFLHTIVNNCPKYSQ